MTTVYYYNIGAPSNISTLVATLNYKITIDLDIPTINYISTIYNITTETIEVTFSLPLSNPEIDVLNNLANIILYGAIVGNGVYVINYNSFDRRSFGVTNPPSINSDNVSGYSIGSIVTTISNDIYICTNDTTANAVWIPIKAIKNKEITYYPDASTSTPKSQEIFLAPGLNFSRPYNSFIESIITRIGFNFKISIDMNMSIPIKINIGFVCDSSLSGNINWTLIYTFSTTNTPLYLNNTDASNNPNPNAITVNKITSIPSNSNKMNLNETIIADCSNMPSPLSNNIFFYGTITRNATLSNTSDTYQGSAFLVSLDYDYVT